MDFTSYTLSASPTQQKCLSMNDTLLVQTTMILGGMSIYAAEKDGFSKTSQQDELP
jgi:hypothetical protein